jgi:hypothetical protein
MAAKHIHRMALLASCCVVGSGLASSVAEAQSQAFTMRLEYAVTYTPYFPNGQIDTSPPFTLCRDNAIALRFRYQWTNNFQEYVYTEPTTSPYPYYFVQGISPNPAFMPAAQPGGPVVRMVDVGLISSSVNTSGMRQVGFRGRTSGFFGNPIQTATANVLIETQIQPPPTQYAEIVDGTLEMPTRPWLRWFDSLADNKRLDIAKCADLSAVTPGECGLSNMPGLPLDANCGTSQYCWVGTDFRHQVATALTSDTPYQYRVVGRNQCGVSNEFDSTPQRPFFKTAQACFVVPNGTIPDGGSVSFDAATLTAMPLSLAADLRVTVHADHPDVSDLRISLTKTSPVVAGPLLLMDRPTGANCVNGKRIQTAFASNGTPMGAGCKPEEPAISGRTAPLQSLASFAPLEGAGTWRLTVEDTEADGKAGSLLEWCLSTDPQLPPLQAAPFVNPVIFSSGFE